MVFSGAAMMWLRKYYSLLALAIFAAAGVFCPLCAMADDIPGLVPVKPIVGSVDCTKIREEIPACPHVPLTAYQREMIPASSVNSWAVARLVVRKFLGLPENQPYVGNGTYPAAYGLYPSSLQPINPQRGFDVKMTLAYPGVSMNVNMDDMNTNWAVLGGAVRPFNNNQPYAVMRFIYRW